MKKSLKNATALMLGFASLAVMASSNPAKADSNTSSASSNSLYDKLSEKMNLNYWGYYRGPSLSYMSDANQPGADGALDPSAPQGLENYITAGYRFDKNWSLNAVAHFYAYPVGNPAHTGLDATMCDPSVMIQRSNLIDNGNGLHLTGRLYLTPGVTNTDVAQTYDVLRTHDVLGSVTATGILSWDVPHTRLNLGIYAYVTGYVPSANAADNVRSYKIYAAPNAAYAIGKTVQATMWVDAVQITRAANTGFVAGMDNYTMDVEPGVNWDITPNLSVNPLLNIYPSNPTLAATSLQAVIVGKVF